MNLGSGNRVHHTKGKIDAEAKVYVIMSEFADKLSEQLLQWVYRR